VEGTLDMVRASDSSFTLLLPEGRMLSGRLVGRPILGLARLLGRLLLVFGNGQFGAAGELESIEADGFIPNDGQAWTLSADDLPVSNEVAEEMNRRFQSTWGAWPGDETDEQIEQALKDLG
jgi:hypothetical protein